MQGRTLVEVPLNMFAIDSSRICVHSNCEATVSSHGACGVTSPVNQSINQSVSQSVSQSIIGYTDLAHFAA